MTAEEIVRSPVLLELLERSVQNASSCIAELEMAWPRKIAKELPVWKQRKEEYTKLLEAVKDLRDIEALAAPVKPPVDFSKHWSKPYHGISCLGESGVSKQLHWCSATDYTSFVEVKLYTPVGSIYKIEKRIVHGSTQRTMREAKRLCEHWLQNKNFEL